MEIRKDLFGKYKIYDGLFPVGEIKPNNDIVNNFGRKLGTYIGENQGLNLIGARRTLEQIMRGF